MKDGFDDFDDFDFFLLLPLADVLLLFAADPLPDCRPTVINNKRGARLNWVRSTVCGSHCRDTSLLIVMIHLAEWSQAFCVGN